MGDNGRWIVGFAVAVALLGAIVWMRRSIQGPPPEPARAVPARIPTHGQKSIVPRNAGIESQEGNEPFEPIRRDAPAIHPNRPLVTPAKPIAPRGSATEHALEGTPAPGEEIAAGEVPAEKSKKVVKDGAALSVPFDGSATAADQTAPIIVEGLEFDPRFGAARFGAGSTLAYPDSGGINLEEGTIMFWVRTEWDTRDPTVSIEGRTLAELRTNTWENRVDIHMGPRFLTFMLTTSDGIEHGTGSPIQWAAGEWHNVATTWGQALMSLYVDTEAASENAYDGTVELPPDTPLYVGSTKAPLKNQGTVWIRGWQVFQRALAQEEIAAVASQTVPPPASASSQ